MSKRYSKIVLKSGVSVLDNGKLIKMNEVINRLNRLDELEQLALCNVSCSLPEQKDFISSIKEDIEVMNFHYTDREKLLIRLGADYAYSKMHKHINE